MGILIDSDVLISLERTGAAVDDYIRGREDEDLFISVISASELLHGVHRAAAPRARARRSAFVEAILSAVPVLGIDLNTARAHARLWSELKSSGRMIGVHDSWLAATCVAHDLTMVTGNTREFKRVPGLTIEVWD